MCKFNLSPYATDYSVWQKSIPVEFVARFVKLSAQNRLKASNSHFP